MKRNHSIKSGYIYLLTVLVVGVVASAVTFSFVLLATSAAKTGITVERSAEAMAVAQGCAEYALRSVLLDAEYAGVEEKFYGNGSCDILRIVGSGNENRTLCVEAKSGNITRRLEIIIQQLLPQVKIFSWQEVSLITACSYE